LALRAGSSRDAPSPVSVSTRASTPVAAKTAALEAAGERRDVTMMFCDLVEQPAFLRGSTPRSGATWSGRISTPAGGDRRTAVRTAWTSALNPSWGDVLELAGEDPDVIRDEVPVALGDYEAIFRAQERTGERGIRRRTPAARCAALAWPRSLSVTGKRRSRST
jgi:hypothetical protein